MSDAFVGVLESTDPAAKQVDNDAVLYGAVTRYRQRIAVPDGADVALGAQGDVAWVSGNGSLIAISKAEFAKLETIRALLAGTLSVNVGLTDTQLRASAVPVSGPLTDTQLRASAVPVSGAFFPATQPVSLATNTPDVTDRTARLLGHVTVDNASLAVTGADNVATVGGSAIALKALPANGSGQAALPVWNAAIQFATYDAGARAIVTGALTANTAKPVLSIEHSAASTKNVRIRRIIAHMIQTTALSGMVDLELHRGTAASSAGTVRTPTARNAADPASEAVVKSLPTITAATVLDTFPLGGFATTTTLYSPPVVVYDWQEAGETKTYILRAGVLESFVLNAISSAAHNLTMAVAIDFTEE